MAITSAQVQQLYVAYLGRAADKGGLDYWLGELNAEPAKITLDQIRANFVNEQPEYKEVYGGLSRVDTVTKIYNNLFGRAPDAGGLTYWTTGAGANVGVDDLLVAFINGAAPADATTITNKVLISELYTAAAGTDAYVAADAKTIITGVTDNASLATNLGKLTDGSLSGIALNTATVNLKASVAADAAVTAYETNQLATLKSIADQLNTLTKANADLADTNVATGSSVTSYTALDGDLSAALTAARAGAAALNGKTTATLTTEATAASDDLAEKDTAFRTDKNFTNAGDLIINYDKAVKAVAANPKVADGVKADAINALAAYGASSSNTAAWTKALADAGLTPTGTTLANAVTDAGKLYDFLTATTTTATKVSTIASDFSGVSAFTAFGTAAAQDKLAVKAAEDKSTAGTALTTADGTASAWKTSYDANVTAQEKLAASKALDAVEASYKTVDTAYDALVEAKGTAAGNLPADSKIDSTTTPGKAVLNDLGSKAQVFYFADKKVDGSDGSFTIGSFAAGKDSLYIGEGYTLNKSATLGTTGITGADNNKLEVFFVKETATSDVKVVIETSVAGSLAVTGGTLPTSGTDTVSVITLTGVTDVSQVQFANGIISHV